MGNCNQSAAYEPPIMHQSSGGGTGGPVSFADIIGDANDNLSLKSKLLQKAAVNHNHNDLYSLLGHNHDGLYAQAIHNHTISQITGLQAILDGINTALSNKASITHNHDGLYAGINHKHDDLYSKLGHSHVVNIADIPNLEYVLSMKSDIDHKHDELYSKLNHNHNDIYSLLGHNHDDLYAPLSHVADAHLHVPIGGGVDQYLTKDSGGVLTWKTVTSGGGTGAVGFGDLIGAPSDSSSLVNYIYDNYAKISRTKEYADEGPTMYVEKLSWLGDGIGVGGTEFSIGPLKISDTRNFSTGDSSTWIESYSDLIVHGKTRTDALRIPTTFAAAGKVWTCMDSDGNGEWATIPGSGGGGTVDWGDITGEVINSTTLINYLTRYALTTHKHDDLYSLLNHNHDDRYAPINHDASHTTYFSSLFVTKEEYIVQNEANQECCDDLKSRMGQVEIGLAANYDDILKLGVDLNDEHDARVAKDSELGVELTDLGSQLTQLDTYVKDCCDRTTTALNGKASLNHNHATSDITGLDGVLAQLQSDLNGKASSSHGHAIGDITGLQTALDNKVATGDARLSDARTPLAHSQDISTINGLQTALDANKQASAIVLDTTNFNKNLSATENTLQKALEKLDDLNVGGNVTGAASTTTLDTSTFTGILTTNEDTVQKAMEKIDDIPIEKTTNKVTDLSVSSDKLYTSTKAVIDGLALKLDASQLTAANTTVDTTLFNGLLTATESTVQKALEKIDDIPVEKTTNKATDLCVSDNTHYPTTKAVVDGLATKLNADQLTAANTSVDTTNFNKNLSSTENTLQKALDKLDDLSAGSTLTVETNSAPLISRNTIDFVGYSTKIIDNPTSLKTIKYDSPNIPTDWYFKHDVPPQLEWIWRHTDGYWYIVVNSATLFSGTMNNLRKLRITKTKDFISYSTVCEIPDTVVYGVNAIGNPSIVVDLNNNIYVVANNNGTNGLTSIFFDAQNGYTPTVNPEITGVAQSTFFGIAMNLSPSGKVGLAYFLRNTAMEQLFFGECNRGVWTIEAVGPAPVRLASTAAGNAHYLFYNSNNKPVIAYMNNASATTSKASVAIKDEGWTIYETTSTILYGAAIDTQDNVLLTIGSAGVPLLLRNSDRTIINSDFPNAQFYAIADSVGNKYTTNGSAFAAASSANIMYFKNNSNDVYKYYRPSIVLGNMISTGSSTFGVLQAMPYYRQILAKAQVLIYNTNGAIYMEDL